MDEATRTQSNVFGRELSLGELLERSFQLARQNYLRVLPFFVAFGIVSTILASSISLATPTIPLNFQVNNSADLASLANITFKYIGYSLANYFVSWTLLYFVAGIGIWKMDQALHRQQDALRQDSFPAKTRRINFASLAITTVLAVVIIEAGIFLIIIGALIFGTMLYLSLVASMVEGRSPFASLGRSRQLVSGRWFKTFILLAAVQIIIAIFANVLGTIAGLSFSSAVMSNTVSTVVTNFAMALAFPLVSASMLVLYYSNRARHESFLQKPVSPYDNMKPEPMGVYPQTRVSQEKFKFCPSCGTELTQTERFCHNCGTPLPT